MIGAILGKLLLIRVLRTKLLIRPKRHVLHDVRCFVDVLVADIAIARPKLHLKAHHCRVRHINKQAFRAVFQLYFFDRMFHLSVALCPPVLDLFAILFAVLALRFFLLACLVFSAVRLSVRFTLFHRKVTVAIFLARTNFIDTALNCTFG